MKKSLLLLFAAVFLAFALSGCIESAVSNVASMTAKHGEQLKDAAHEFTPEEEAAIGRAVGARIITKYHALDDPAANSYVNQLGQALAMRGAGPVPQGYHFLILNSPEVNAFAAPGGLIFVTTGMLRLMSDESELAAVLAHEITHVQNRDAIAAIQSSRKTSATTGLFTDAAFSFAPMPGSGFVNLFSGAIDDVFNSLVVKGYSHGQEFAADAGAKTVLSAGGYDPRALESVLQAMSQQVSPGSAGFGSTHPSAKDRLAKIGASGAPVARDTGVRAERFQAALGKYVAAK